MHLVYSEKKREFHKPTEIMANKYGCKSEEWAG